MSDYKCRRLEGKVAVVAGAATGIGRACALRLAGEGAKVVVGHLAAEQAQIDSLVAEIADGGSEAVAVAFDATDDASIAALIAAADKFGRLDAVHANFADLRVIMDDSDAVSISDEVLERTLDVDLKGMLRITRHAIPKLLEGEPGALIYTSSVASLVGEAVRPGYAMAKAGINALVRHCASAFGRKGLRANAVLPGFVNVPEKAGYLGEEFQKQVLAGSRSFRLGTPEDIAAMVALLASSEGEWINGQTFAVDGGSSMR